MSENETFICTFCGDHFDSNDEAELCLDVHWRLEDERNNNLEDVEDYSDEVEPDLSFQYEHDSAMASAGWGTDEDYGYYGDDY